MSLSESIWPYFRNSGTGATMTLSSNCVKTIGVATASTGTPNAARRITPSAAPSQGVPGVRNREMGAGHQENVAGAENKMPQSW